MGMGSCGSWCSSSTGAGAGAGAAAAAACKSDNTLYYTSTSTRTRSRRKGYKSPLVPTLCLSASPISPISNDGNNNSNTNRNHTAPVGVGADDPPVHSCLYINLPTYLGSIWKWRGYSIRYQCCGHSGPALVLVHGFGANSDHWRKNLPVLGTSHRVYSIDLIGYGYSDKPDPRHFSFTFPTWASQLNAFCLEVVKDEAFFICNSIGGLVGLQAAVTESQICKGLVLLNISLRMLHIKKQPPLGRPLIKAFQSLLRNTSLGELFYKAVATPQSVKNILCQCYHDTSQVTEELVEKILLPGLEPGAVDVFLEFICYSDGPLPEELLPQVKCPVLVVWGDKDPWEPIELGRAYGNFEAVEDFIVLPGVGHCPQDEAPHLVNPLVQSFVERHSATKGAPSEILA